MKLCKDGTLPQRRQVFIWTKHVMNICVPTHICTSLEAISHAYMHTCIHTCMAQTHVCTHANRFSQTDRLTRAHTYARMHPRSHACTHTHAHTYMHKHTHKDTHTHSHTHTHTHTHTWKQLLIKHKGFCKCQVESNTRPLTSYPQGSLTCTALLCFVPAPCISPHDFGTQVSDTGR